MISMPYAFLAGPASVVSMRVLIFHGVYQYWYVLSLMGWPLVGLCSECFSWLELYALSNTIFHVNVVIKLFGC